MAKETAEQKLLRLIEQSDDSGEAQQSSTDAASPQQVLNAVQSVGAAPTLPPVFANILSLVKNTIAHPTGQGFSVRTINKILGLVVVIAVIFFVSSVFKGMGMAQRTISFQVPEGVSFVADKLLPSMPDVKEYLEAFSYRNIFHPFEKKKAKSEVDEVPQVAQQIFEKTKSFKLVGISWFDTPESASAMVENTDSGVTYFLKSGESFNGVNVQSIYADSIVLEFAGERMELKL